MSVANILGAALHQRQSRLLSSTRVCVLHVSMCVYVCAAWCSVRFSSSNGPLTERSSLPALSKQSSVQWACLRHMQRTP